MVSPVYQGQPFPFAAEIVAEPSVQLTGVTAFVTDSEGEVVVQEIVLSKQRRRDVYEGQIPGIAHTGMYSLTLHVEGESPAGRKGSLDKTVGFVVGWPFWVRLILGLLVVLILGLGVFGAVRWHYERLKRIPLGNLRVVQPQQYRGKAWDLGGFESNNKEVFIGLDAGHISLTPGQFPTGLYARFYGLQEGEEVVTYVVSLRKEQPVTLNDTPLKKGEKTRLYEGSRLRVGDYELEYIAPPLERY